MKIKELLETTSGGSTGAGSIASISSPLGGPMAAVIKRMPPGQSFFAPQVPTKKPKKKAKRR